MPQSENHRQRLAWMPLLHLLVFWCCLALLYGIARRYLADGWPAAAEARLHVGWGMATVALSLLAAAAVVRADQHWQSGRLVQTRRWLVVACGWATLLLGCKTAELWQLSRHNLLANPLRQNVFARPDLRYVQAVAHQLERRVASIVDSRRRHFESGRSVNDRQQRLIVDLLQQQLVGWTQQAVVAEPNPQRQRALLAAFAQEIFPIESRQLTLEHMVAGETQRLQTQIDRFRAELLALLEPERQAGQRFDQLFAEKQHLLEQQTSLQTEWAALDERRPLSEEAERRQAELTQQLEVLRRQLQENAQASRLTAETATRLQTQELSIRNEIVALEGRLELREKMEHCPAGLNAGYPSLRLPVSLPGGAVWAWAFTGLSILHAVYAALGLLWLACLRGSLVWQQVPSPFLVVKLYWGLAALSAVGLWLGFYL